MVTGTVELEFLIHHAQSLKEKRSVVKSIVDRTKHRFGASIAEVGCLDLCQRARIGIAVVSNDKRHANSMLDTIIDFIEKMHVAELIQIEMHFF